MTIPYGFTADTLLERFSEQQLVEITDKVNNPPETRDDAAIERAGHDAFGEFHKHAGKFYVTPVDPLPDWLRPDLLDLWAWRLVFNCRPDWLEVEQTNRGYSWSDRRKELVTWLKGLSSPKRESTLPGCTEVAERTSVSGIAYRSGTPRMTAELLRKCP